MTHDLTVPNEMMLRMIDNMPLADCGAQVSSFYVDCTAKIEVVPPGANVRIMYVEARRIAGQDYR